MRRIVGTLLLLFCTCLGAVQAANLTIPATHPRLWYGNAARLAQARQYFATNPFTPAGDDRLVELALRSLLTNTPADCNEPATALRGFNIAIPPSNQRGGFRDDIRQQGEQWLSIYDWCHASFTPQERQTLVDRWNAYMAFELTDNLGNAGQEANNYWAGRTANLLTWGIISYGENPRAQEFINAALDTRLGGQFAGWYNNFGRGGVFPEGGDYGIVSLSYPLLPFVSAADFGYDAFATTPYFNEAIYALIYGSTPGPVTIGVTPPGTNPPPYQPRVSFFPFNDDENFYNYGTINAREYVGDFVSLFALRNPGSGNARHAAAWRALSAPGRRWMFAALAPQGNPLDLAELPLDYYAPGSGVMAMRTGHDANAMSVHLQLGTPGGTGHRHWDAGNFQIVRKGRWLTRESVGYSDRIVEFGQPSGSNVTTDIGEAPGHNTLLFEGANTAIWIGSGPQPVPPGGLPDRDQPRGLPRVARLHSDDDFSFVAVDYSDAYRNGRDTRADWPYADKVWREFIFVRPLQALVILDRMQASSDSQRPFYLSNSWLWDGPHVAAAQVRRTFLMHFEAQPVVQGGRVTAPAGTATTELVTLVPAAPTYRVVNEDVRGDELFGQYRLELDSVGSPASYFLNVVTGHDAGEAPLQASVSGNGQVWVVTLSHPQRGTARIMLRPGVTSHGGSVSYGGRTTLLCGAVQGSRVTADGPQWDAPCPGDDLFYDGLE